MRKLASIIALGGLSTAVACGDDGISGASTTGGEDSTSSTGGGQAFTTAITTQDDTADATGGSSTGDPGDASTGDADDTSTGEPPSDSSTGEPHDTSTGEPPSDSSSSDGGGSCGNGMLEGAEECDADELGGATCAGLGFGAGEVACTARCQLDTSACCGDGQQGGTEACDAADLDGQTCVALGYPGGTLACAADCTLDDSGCSVCGDGAIGDGEDCDGTELGGADCTSLGLGFFGGTLACAPATCQFDTSGCNACGNGAVDAGEACDGADLGGATCASLGLGFTGGTLACESACELDTSGCTSFPVPGVGGVVISEIMYDPAVLGDNAGGEWFELHNPSASDTLELQGCTVESNNASETFTIGTPFPIPPGGYVVLAGSPDPLAIGFVADYVLPSTFSLANAGDFVRLSCGGALVDEVAYDDAAPWPDPPSGRSINLGVDSLDASSNDAGGAWCAATNDYFMGELGTPGAANTECAGVPTWTIGFCRLQFPTSIDEPAGTAVTVYGRVYAENLTDQSTATDPDPQLVAQLGWGPDGSDPATDASWTWIGAVPNPGWDGVAAGEADNDEYQATLVVPPPPPSDRDYAYRLSGDGGATFTYCDGDNGGSTTGYAAQDAGQLVSQAAAVPALWFSEYIEGTSTNKAIEIYNGGSEPAVLDACTLLLYFNASLTPSQLDLAGTLDPGETFVVCDSGFAVPGLCDVDTSPTWNGDDTIVLECSGTTLDAFGQIGFDPGTAWTIAGVTTANDTLRRSCGVTAGDPDASDVFDPSLEWTGAGVDAFDDLGQHDCP